MQFPTITKLFENQFVLRLSVLFIRTNFKKLYFVAKVGLEPTRSLPPGDFKSPTSRQFRHSARDVSVLQETATNSNKGHLNFTISSCGMQDSNHASHKASRSYGRNVFTSFTNTAFVSSTSFNIELYVLIVNPSRYLSILSVTSSQASSRFFYKASDNPHRLHYNPCNSVP